jgi:hypothetical protein
MTSYNGFSPAPSDRSQACLFKRWANSERAKGVEPSANEHGPGKNSGSRKRWRSPPVSAPRLTTTLTHAGRNAAGNPTRRRFSSTKIATIARNGGSGGWAVTPDNTSVFMVRRFPLANVYGSGNGARAITINVKDGSGNNVSGAAIRWTGSMLPTPYAASDGSGLATFGHQQRHVHAHHHAGRIHGDAGRRHCTGAVHAARSQAELMALFQIIVITRFQKVLPTPPTECG